jgi:hypothetical protein
MADTVANTTLQNTSRRLVVRSQFTIDGTEAADLILVDKSAFVGPDGTEPSKLVVEKIAWDLNGFSVLVEFDHDTDDKIATISGVGEISFTENSKFQGFIDPASTGATGDIVATTLTTDAGDEGFIVLYLRKKD